MKFELVPLAQAQAVRALTDRKAEPGLVVALRRKNSCLTLQEIAGQCGVSRERVRQILAREGLPTRAVHVGPRCAQCQKPIDQRSKSGFCGACLHPAVWADIPCFQCGAPVHKLVASIANNARRGGQGRVFCNRRCSGQWRGEISGFGAHPEHSRQTRLFPDWLHANTAAHRFRCSYRALTAACKALGVERRPWKRWGWLIPVAALPALRAYLAVGLDTSPAAGVD